MSCEPTLSVRLMTATGLPPWVRPAPLLGEDRWVVSRGGEVRPVVSGESPESGDSLLITDPLLRRSQLLVRITPFGSSGLDCRLVGYRLSPRRPISVR